MTPTKESKTPDTALYAAREEVIAAIPEIITAIIDKAKDGSYQHAKFLLDFAGGAIAEANASGGEESLASLLMKELKEEPRA